MVGIHKGTVAAPNDIYANASAISLMHVGNRLWWLWRFHEGLVRLQAVPAKQRVLVFNEGQTLNRCLLGVAVGADDLEVV